MVSKLFRVLAFIVFMVMTTLALFRVNAWWQEGQSAAGLSPTNGHFIKTSLGTMHVSIWGKDSDTPVVMSHGMAAWGGLWEETAKFLAQNNYRVIAVDMPPFGFSDRSNKDFSRSQQAARLNALINAMQLDKYILVGHSYGGGIAMETGMRYPGRMAGLVLVCPVLVLTEKGKETKAGTIPLPLKYPFLAEILVSATVTNPLLTSILIKSFMHQKDALTPRHIEILQKPIGLEGNTANMVLWLQQFLAGDAQAVSRDRKKLSKSQVPVSLIWGEKDTIAPIQQGEELSTMLNPIRFSRLPNIGHMPQLESPKLFNETLLKTLREFPLAKWSMIKGGELRGSL